LVGGRVVVIDRGGRVSIRWQRRIRWSSPRCAG